VISKIRSRTRTRSKKTRTLHIHKNIYMYIILCRQESRETLPLQLPLYSLSLSLTLNIKTHDLSPNLSPPCIYFSCKHLYYTYCYISWRMLVFPKDQRSTIIKKIQSSKSWYLKIALILSIENPLPRSVVVRTVNTNPEERGSSPPCSINKFRAKSKQLFWLI
jgi:hypothetical protein